MTIVKVIYLPVLLFGCESWVLYQQAQKIDTMYGTEIFQKNDNSELITQFQQKTKKNDKAKPIEVGLDTYNTYT